VAHVLTVLTGVAFGALLNRPIIDRLTWVLLVAVAILLAAAAVPVFPPVRLLLTLIADEPLDPGASARAHRRADGGDLRRARRGRAADRPRQDLILREGATRR